jgi:hypothetical protein
MAELAPPSLCFVTPTYRADLERFALLRRSIGLFAPGIPHLAFVDTEDAALFRRRFGAERGLEIIASAEILPRAIEAGRRRRRSWQGALLQRIGWRLGLETRMASGWKLQQIIKLEALARLPYAAAVFLDSDIVLCGRLAPADFFDGTALRLLETPALTYEDHAFEVARQILVGGSLLQRACAFNYIHQAPRFLRRTGQTLLQHLGATHADWTARFYAQAFPSEYCLLGHTARVLEDYADYRREDSDPESWIYNVKTADALEPQLARCRHERGARKFLLVQSNMHLAQADYLPRVDALLKELAASA